MCKKGGHDLVAMAAKPKVGCSAASADRTIYERQDSSRRVGCRDENPSQRTLADIFQVNRSTVTAAIDELTSQGLLEGRRGGGTKVVNSTWSMLAAEPPLDWSDYVRSGIHRANSSIIQAINQNEPRADIIRLGTGELSPDLVPADTIGRMFQQINPGALSLGYEQPKGNRQLRRQWPTI